MTSASARIVEEAAKWAALVDSRTASAAEVKAYRIWRDADPAHRETVERMLSFDPAEHMSGLERRALNQIIGSKPKPARSLRAGGAAIAVLLVAAGVWLGWRSDAVQDRFPTYQVAVGMVRQADLADGSVLTIDTDSTVTTDLEGSRRKVRLIRGRVLAQVSHDPSRPFVVETAEGTATALGTAYTVSREGVTTLVEVASSSVRVCARTSASCRVLGPGQRARIADGRVSMLNAEPAALIGQWASGWLEADDQDIAQVIDTLNHYRSDPIGYDAAALAGTRVTGSYPLTDPDRALRAIGQTPGAALVKQRDGGWHLVREASGRP